jgi:hypothetical protein
VSPEAAFYQNRRKRAGMVRRIGNLASKIKSSDRELVAMHSELLQVDNACEAIFLRHVIAAHLEFVSPLRPGEVSQIAKTAGVAEELAGLRRLKEDLSDSPPIIQAAFADVAKIAVKNGEL